MDATPLSEQRRARILAAAREVFVEDGFRLGSTARIADLAGTPGRAVAQLFADKDALLTAVIERACDDFEAALPVLDLRSRGAPKARLRAYALAVHALLTSADHLKIQRLVLSEVRRRPDLGRLLLQRTALAAEGRLANYIAQTAEAPVPPAGHVRAFARLVLSPVMDRPLLSTLLRAGSSDAPDMTTLDLTIAAVVRDARLASR